MHRGRAVCYGNDGDAATERTLDKGLILGGLQDSGAWPTAPFRPARAPLPPTARATWRRRRALASAWRRSLAGLLVAIVVVAAACGGWAGFLRLTGNVHEIEPGIYRTGQLRDATLAALVRDHGIKTVINLRGRNPGKPWYDAEEKAVAETGATYVSLPMSANHEPDAALLAKLIDTVETAPRPLLIHCEAGADRTGLASALYELLVMHRTPAVADEQLSFRYGHFPWLISHTGAMDRTFAKVVAETH